MKMESKLISSTLKLKLRKHIVFGNILQLEIVQKQRKEDPRMLVACFVTAFSGCSTQLHIFWSALSRAKTRQKYSHVLQSTKRMMAGVDL